MTAVRVWIWKRKWPSDRCANTELWRPSLSLLPFYDFLHYRTFTSSV